MAGVLEGVGGVRHTLLITKTHCREHTQLDAHDFLMQAPAAAAAAALFMANTHTQTFGVAVRCEATARRN